MRPVLALMLSLALAGPALAETLRDPATGLAIKIGRAHV